MLLSDLHYFLILLLPCIMAQCPSSDISPCTCSTVDNSARIYCSGDIWLPRLTSVLQEDMCGKTIDQFELFDSNITYLPSNIFYKTIVKEIRISSTNITRFTEGGDSAFYGVEGYLQSLSMRRCHLVDSLQWEMIGKMGVLIYLDLSYNYLISIPRTWFNRPPPRLRSLILKGNNILSLESGALKYMHNLVELDLSENRIKSFVRDSLPYPGNLLIFLRLSDNQLDQVPDYLFDEMLGVRRIYLDNNNLETLPQFTWAPIWGDMDTVELSGNPFKCNCKIHWIPLLRAPTKLYGSCRWPDEVVGNKTVVKETLLKNLHEDQFKSCDVNG